MQRRLNHRQVLKALLRGDSSPLKGSEDLSRVHLFYYNERTGKYGPGLFRRPCRMDNETDEEHEVRMNLREDALAVHTPEEIQALKQSGKRVAIIKRRNYEHPN